LVEWLFAAYARLGDLEAGTLEHRACFHELLAGGTRDLLRVGGEQPTQREVEQEARERERE
jgi:hypothetical protein